jgi:glycine/D-amino acid oxidase-like deaminating enzyme
VAQLLDEARAAGVVLQPGRRAATLIERDACIVGIVDGEGEPLAADAVVVAAGSWTQHLLPWLDDQLRSVGQPVFHLRPRDPAPYRAERFPVFGADIARTGYYGFCANADGIVKIANHGVGRAMHPESPARAVTADEEAALRAFLGDTLPSLAAAPIVHTRVCVYGDTADEHFLIAADPDRAGLVVAAGGSGHGFKFAPVLGDLIADAVEGREEPLLRKFRWRPGRRLAGEEAARHRR